MLEDSLHVSEAIIRGNGRVWDGQSFQKLSTTLSQSQDCSSCSSLPLHHPASHICQNDPQQYSSRRKEKLWGKRGPEILTQLLLSLGLWARKTLICLSPCYLPMLCRDFVSVISTPCTVLQVEYCHYCAGERNLRWQSRKPVSSPPLMNIPKSPLTVGQSSVKKTGTYQKRSFTIKVIKKAPQWGGSEPGTHAIIKSLILQVDNPTKQKINILSRILPPELRVLSLSPWVWHWKDEPTEYLTLKTSGS